MKTINSKRYVTAAVSRAVLAVFTAEVRSNQGIKVMTGSYDRPAEAGRSGLGGYRA